MLWKMEDVGNHCATTTALTVMDLSLTIAYLAILDFHCQKIFDVWNAVHIAWTVKETQIFVKCAKVGILPTNRETVN